MKHCWKATAFLLALAMAGCQAGAPPEPESESGRAEAQPDARNEATDDALGFANPELLVDTEWLADHLGDEGIRILDTRSEEKYAEGHIPGAVRVDRSDYFDPAPEPGSMVGSPEQVAERFGAKGVDEYAHVIVYDEGVSTSAARVFWTLEYYGHPEVSVLNGGLTKWQAEGRELSTETPEPTAVTFTVRPNPAAVSTQDEVTEDLADETVVILDARSAAEFNGDVVNAERGGHIPGAVNIEWTQNFTEGEAPVFKPSFQLAQMYQDQGVTRDKRVHAY